MTRFVPLSALPDWAGFPALLMILTMFNRNEPLLKAPPSSEFLRQPYWLPLPAQKETDELPSTTANDAKGTTDIHLVYMEEGCFLWSKELTDLSCRRPVPTGDNSKPSASNLLASVTALNQLAKIAESLIPGLWWCLPATCRPSHSKCLLGCRFPLLQILRGAQRMFSAFFKH